MNGGYCRNGVHYVIPQDECPKCDLWEQQNRERDLFHRAVDAHLLKTAIDWEVGQ